MMSGVFVTGTDTGIGKTYFSKALLLAMRKQNKIAAGMKPVASGCTRHTDSVLYNDDALLLRASSHPVAQSIDYSVLNPYAFEIPIAPHIAAIQSAVEIDIDVIQSAYFQLLRLVEYCVVEGVGGWAVPLSAQYMQTVIPKTLKLPVIMVVGVRLGCINHALLTEYAIKHDHCHLIGWVANVLDPDLLEYRAAIETLETRLSVPCLAKLNIADADHDIDLEQIISLMQSGDSMA